MQREGAGPPALSRAETESGMSETEDLGGEQEDATTGSTETEWEENEPSPHQGEEGQQESEA
jgi:hypothetical protein